MLTAGKSAVAVQLRDAPTRKIDDLMLFHYVKYIERRRPAN